MTFISTAFSLTVVLLWLLMELLLFSLAGDSLTKELLIISLTYAELIIELSAPIIFSYSRKIYQLVPFSVYFILEPFNLFT